MFYTTYEYDARELYKALNSLRNDDNTIVEIFASRPKNHLEIADFACQNYFKISLWVASWEVLVLHLFF